MVPARSGTVSLLPLSNCRYVLVVQMLAKVYRLVYISDLILFILG